jgi:iron(III) transport system substrate-binding protein
MQVDWVKEFSPMLPGIKTAAIDNVMPKYQGRLARQWDVQYVMVYNTKLVKRAELPKSLGQLAEPKWRGRFAMPNNTSNPLDLLALEVGADGVLDMAKKLLANQPRFKPGPPAVVGAIASGEVALGVSGYTALAEAMKEKGAPVDWVALDTLPITPLFVFMLKDAPQPTLGKLFLAWLVTEGLAVQEKEEHLSFFGNQASSTTRAIKAMAPNVKTVEVRSEKDLELVTQTDAAVMRVVAGAAGAGR